MQYFVKQVYKHCSFLRNIDFIQKIGLKNESFVVKKYFVSSVFFDVLFWCRPNLSEPMYSPKYTRILWKWFWTNT